MQARVSLKGRIQPTDLAIITQPTQTTFLKISKSESRHLHNQNLVSHSQPNPTNSKIIAESRADSESKEILKNEQGQNLSGTKFAQSTAQNLSNIESTNLPTDSQTHN
ncbi:hypothetical protein [uncultured Helicobacter sp.]|uniref:hypothetical protein n=1 Tax=uncultured Helicobacter sp. TaxID=175537 RepID=UPI00375366B2